MGLTKDSNINRKAMCFNRMLFDDLCMSNLGVTPVCGFDEFLDSNLLLSRKFSRQFSREGQHEMLHLNETGTRMLANYIKSSIFLKLNNGVDKRKSNMHGPHTDQPRRNAARPQPWVPHTDGL